MEREKIIELIKEKDKEVNIDFLNSLDYQGLLEILEEISANS